MYSPKENTQENHLPSLGRHKRLSFRQRLSKRVFYMAYWKDIKPIC